MTDSEQKFTIPVVFEVAGTTREQAAELLHALLGRAHHLLTDAAPLAGVGDVFYPLEDRWFPDAGLKHIDGNTHADLQLREPDTFADTYAGTPVSDMLAEVFPEMPDPNVFRDESGKVDENAYGAAFDAFTEEALDIALYLRHPTYFLERAEEIKQLREGLTALLDEHPLPTEPRRQDYLVTIAPSYEGEIEDLRYAWDHTQWQADFNRVARAREDGLRRVLASGAGGAKPASAREHQTLQGVTTEPAAENADGARGTAQGEPAETSARIDSSSAAELWTYRVPVEFEVSARAASEARGLVDEALVGGAPTGTPAAVQRRQRVLADGDVYGVLGWQHLSDQGAPVPASSRLERGALLSDLLHGRGRQLNAEDDGDGPEPRRGGLRPDAPGR